MHRSIKFLIWLYVVLLLFEGALRKWVLPGYSDVLLVIRDPVVILIYLLALAQGRFPFNGWIITVVALAGLAVGASFLANQSSLLITVYGLRTNFLHLPLIWVMAAVLTRREAETIGLGLLLMAIPMTLLMAAQFNAPINDIINRGVGGEEGGQIYGALGHIRPPGFFAFITGPQQFFPLAAAFFFHQLASPRRLWLPLVIACGVAIFIALPLSISRTVALATGLVATIYLLTLVRAGVLRGSVFRTAIILAVVLVAAGFLPIFDEAREAFFSRWEEAKGPDDESIGMGSIFSRFFGGSDHLVYLISNTPLFGSGVGMGSNVAARLSTGQMGFMLAESEWAKCIMELGPPLGIAFLGFRVLLGFALLRHSVHRLLHARDSLPLLIFSASATALMVGQWAPPTILGFAVLGSGLCLTACKPTPIETTDEDDEADHDNEDPEYEEDGDGNNSEEEEEPEEH